MSQSAFSLPTVLCTFAVSFGLSASSLAAAQAPDVPELRSAARSNPGDAQAQLALARAYLRAGQLPEAEAQMARYLKASDGSIEALYEAAHVAFASGDSKRARASCQRLARKDPKHVLTHVCTARAFLIWRRAARAQEHVQAALAAAPTNPEALLALSDLKRISNQLSAARKAAEHVLARDASNAPAQLALARTLLLMNERDAAVRALRAALQADPRNPELQFELGKLVSGGESVQLLEAAVRGRPKWQEAQLALANAQLEAGDPKSASVRLQSVIARDARNPEAHAQRGLALMELGRPREAEAELRKAVTLMPNDYDSAFALAQVYERTGRHDDALEQYRHSADIKRESAAPLIAAAQLGISIKRPLLASGMLDRALQREPNSAQALALYGDSWVARNDRTAARTYYERALKGEGPLDRAAVQKNLAELSR